MNNFGKKIIGILGIVVFLISFGFAQEEGQTATTAQENGQTATPAGAKCPRGKEYYNTKTGTGDCCFGILLNTNVPFIGQCILGSSQQGDGTKVSQERAFPILMGGLMKILVTIIILMGFVIILAAGVMISASGGDTSRATKGKDRIIKVVIAFALLGASGVILRIINPNFFG